MSAKNPNASASMDQLADLLLNKFPDADLARAAGLDGLQLVRSARSAALRSEHRRLLEKLGPDDPRVTALAARHARNELLVHDLGIEAQRARVAVPEAEKDQWIFHGLVRDQELRPFPSVTVALYDENGDWIKQLGYGVTNANGNFRIEARNLSDLDSPLFAHILTSQGAHLHTDDTEITPAIGTVLYHEIVVSGEKAGTPPGDSRPDPVVDPGVWTVRGRVSDKSGKGLSNLVVSLYDKDLFFDDRLGQTETDAWGEFNFAYRTEDFRDIIERKPDIYVKVLDQKGKTLYTSKKLLRFEAGRVEIVNVEIEEPGK